jgi:hypothetical protein
MTRTTVIEEEEDMHVQDCQILGMTGRQCCLSKELKVRLLNALENYVQNPVTLLPL